MIAVDSCVVISYFAREKSAAVAMFDRALEHGDVWLPPVVTTEILSNRSLSQQMQRDIKEIRLLDTDIGYWERAGRLRASVLALGFKAHLGDALIAQSCIDHDVPLLTTDTDFRHYVKAGGLKLAVK